MGVVWGWILEQGHGREAPLDHYNERPGGLGVWKAYRWDTDGKLRGPHHIFFKAGKKGVG